MTETEHRRRMTKPVDAAGVAMLVQYRGLIPGDPMQGVDLWKCHVWPPWSRGVTVLDSTADELWKLHATDG